MKAESLKLKIENYFNCSSLLRREAGREGKKGFTLAEILIALTVIGVISAVTVPVLMQNTNKQEYVSKLQKVYSTLSQAANQIIAEEGSPKGEGSWLEECGGDTGVPCDTYRRMNNMYKQFSKRLSLAKDCGKNDAGCFSQTRFIKALNKSSTEDMNYGSHRYSTNRMILQDGTYVKIAHDCCDGNCGFNKHGTTGSCCHIRVDLNGGKGPNQMGRDVFQFDLKENGLFPSGCDSDYCNPQASANAGQGAGAGTGCACRVLKEGRMDY